MARNAGPVDPKVLERLGSNLREDREDAGLTIDQLAAALEASSETITEIERGEREATLRDWIAIETGIEIASGRFAVPAAERPTNVDFAARFGRLVRSFRDRRGMSVYDLGKRTAEDPDYILSLEAGEQEPGMTQWIKMVDVLEIPNKGAFAWVQGFELPPDPESWLEGRPPPDDLEDEPEDEGFDGGETP